MRIHFSINYFTSWGQNMALSGTLPQLGGGDPAKAVYMNFQWRENWSYELEIKTKEPFEFQYKYIIRNSNMLDTFEWGEDRIVSVNPAVTEDLYLYDTWNNPGAIENVFMTSPFQDVLFKDNYENVLPKNIRKYTHIFRVKAPLLKPGEALCIVGNAKALGKWDTTKALLMNHQDSPWWSIKVDLSKEKSDSVSYKFAIYDLEDKHFKYFENGPDHYAPINHQEGSLTIVSGTFVAVDPTQFHGAGVGIPVFSIRTKQSFGVGDFEDMKLLVDWAKKVGLKLIQVLPLNDTIGTHTDADVLPYAAITAFGFSPLYLNLKAMGELDPSNPLAAEYDEKQKRLNALPMVEFMEVINYKLAYAKALYFQEKEKFLNSEGFKQYFEDNKDWLIPYAAFCALRDMNGTSDYNQWGEYSVYNADKIGKFTFGNDEVAVNYFIQYHLHLQLQDAVNYAHQNGIIIKGDIPIGVNRHGVDTWVNPELFHMDMAAGAPPDMFAIKGQNWELPTYNWEAMEATGFKWWRDRLRVMGHYFDTFRIDHILGFFRIWQIPTDQIEGIMGYLNPSIPVHINEFGEKGLRFDYNRFCLPFITDSVIWEIFGDDAPWVKDNCIDIIDGWILRLKPCCDNQAKVQAMYDKRQISEKIKWGLFDLISNVLFFEVKGSNCTQFYPRYGMQVLTTFRYLDDYTKRKIEEIYVDYFYRRQDGHWKYSALRKLPAIKRSTNMMICGEDLGMMADCVTSVMNELGILSLEIQRAPKIDTIEFFHPADAKYLSVVTPSTHDMSTIRGWWEEKRDVTQRFYNQQLGHWGGAPYFAEWWVCRDILVQHLYSPAMWAIFQIQDLFSINPDIRRENPHDERINVPSNSKNSWRYRMHINVEDLLNADAFNKELKNYIVQAGR
jgi:4-alpha-glucanotransferase